MSFHSPRTAERTIFMHTTAGKRERAANLVLCKARERERTLFVTGACFCQASFGHHDSKPGLLPSNARSPGLCPTSGIGVQKPRHLLISVGLAAWNDTPTNLQPAGNGVVIMAPTKKGERKKAGKQKKTTLPDEEKHKKTTLEVDSLKQHLVLRRDVARQAIADSEGLKQKLADLEKELEKARGDKKDIYEEMIRQYQQLQRQTNARIQHLEAKTENLQEQLAACQEDVRRSRADKAKTLEEKDEAISKMQSKIDNMETEYEKILHGSLDCVLSKLQTAKLSWEKEATLIHLEYKDHLKEFGLNPLEL